MKAKSVWLVCLMAIVSLCAVTGRADDPIFPCFPFNPDFPIPPVGPVDDPDRDNTEPIIFVCSRFFASENANLLEVYNDRIAANPADYEAYVCRAFARVATLWGEDDVKYFATGCGLDFDPETEYEYKIDALTGAIVGTKKKLDIF